MLSGTCIPCRYTVSYMRTTLMGLIVTLQHVTRLDDGRYRFRRRDPADVRDELGWECIRTSDAPLSEVTGITQSQYRCMNAIHTQADIGMETDAFTVSRLSSRSGNIPRRGRSFSNAGSRYLWQLYRDLARRVESSRLVSETVTPSRARIWLSTLSSSASDRADNSTIRSHLPFVECKAVT